MKIPSSAGYGAALLSLMLVVACGKTERSTAIPNPPVPAAESQVTEPEVTEPEVTEAEVADATESSPAATEANATEAVAAEGGTLKMRFEYGGDAVEAAKVNVTQDQSFCGQFDLRNERLLVHPENKGIKNALVYVYTGRGGSELTGIEPRGATVTLANENCRFEPHIALSQVGDTLRVTNPDEVGHNANLSFFNNKAENLMIPAGKEALIELKMDEPAPIPVDCNIHPWMKGYVLVLTHPFAGISDENGDLTIKGLPVGETLVFRAFHEAGAIKTVTIGGDEVEWSRSRFEVEIQEGVTDMGTVVIPADALTAE